MWRDSDGVEETSTHIEVFTRQRAPAQRILFVRTFDVGFISTMTGDEHVK